MSGDDCSSSAERGYLQIGATRLSYLVWPGAGPPALLLHGITSSAATLWQIAPALAGAGYRVYALDMPGHGESDVSPDHAIDTIAGLAGASIAALGLAHVTLIGHSWGGAVALALASGAHAARARLAAVVLLDPLLGIDESWAGRVLPRYLHGLGEPAGSLRASLEAANPDWHGCDLYWKAQALEQCRAAQVEGLFLGGGSWELLGRVGDVGVPLLTLVADPAYTIIPQEAQVELARRLSADHGRIVVVPATTHNMHRGAGYAATMAALLDWLGGRS